MKVSKFSEAQIAFVLKQAEGDATIAEVCRKAGIGVATFYNWRKKYAGLMPSEMIGSKRSLLICHWIRPCCRMFCQKNSEA